MPECHREIINEDTEMAVWEITETESELQHGLSLSPEAIERLSNRKSIVHRKGYLAIRQLLKSLGVLPKTHQYDKIGAPYLTDGRYISISHTKDVAAVVISSNLVGIDLEHYQEKIKRIAPRFLHTSEFQIPKNMSEVIYLTHIWTAKEALYKLYKKPGLIFNKQLCIRPFKKESAIGIGEVLDQNNTESYVLHFRRFKNYCLTLATIK
ncbi:4'-phosphopantetheinyl transferase superfamily protein [Flavobacteriaceae bacterium]|jgi:4'-phosphopantetheinyl transferase|nr:4'-phosphopantetheinyl transferase superfamily protein [Flavobacteriaceae bacterium]